MRTNVLLAVLCTTFAVALQVNAHYVVGQGWGENLVSACYNAINDGIYKANHSHKPIGSCECERSEADSHSWECVVIAEDVQPDTQENQ